MRTYRKTADETLLVEIDWDTYVNSSAWTADAGITATKQDSNQGTAKALVSGGTLGTTYKVTCDVTLDNSEVRERSVLVMVVAK